MTQNQTGRFIVAATVLLVMQGALMAGNDWKTEANRRIEKHRKSDYALTVLDPQGKPLAGTEVGITQTASRFHFGMCITGNPDSDSPDEKKYFEFIRKHFNTVVLENHMKWYATEKKRDKLTWETGDRLARWARENGLAIRGHCLFWSKPRYVQDWLKDLPADELRQEVYERIEQIVPRYKETVFCWDVNNEMLDGSFYADKLGEEIRVEMFRRAHKLDPDAGLYVNEYGVLCNDKKMNRYIELIKRLRKAGAPVSGIGIQEHASERFAEAISDDEDRPERKGGSALVPAEVWRRLDEFAKLDMPIHLTEISSKTPDPEVRADTLEALFRVGYAHPQVEAILLWGFWERRHWLGKNAALVSKDWKILMAGKRIAGMLLDEWRTRTRKTTDQAGKLGFRGFHGTYEVSAEIDGKTMTATVELGPDAKPARITLKPK
ncbi:MAG: endo-1,4-beta-xylanase [Phycisphaerae bacterium]